MQRYRLAIVTAVVWAIADWALAVPVVIDPGQGGVTLAKTLLWERLFSAANFEGMTFGPPLADGSRSLLLISDNGGGLAQQLYAVSVVPEPSVLPLVSVGAAAAWWVLRRRP